MDTAVQIVGLTLMVLSLLLLVVSIAGLHGFLPPPPWSRDASQRSGDHG